MTQVGIPTTILETSQELPSQEGLSTMNAVDIMDNMNNKDNKASLDIMGAMCGMETMGGLQNGACHLADVVVCVDMPHR